MTIHMPVQQRPGILAFIGNTPLIEVPRMPNGAGRARIFAKLELMNPTGSMKDRMALAIVEGAEKSGKLKPGFEVVEYSSGSTGTSLAQVCAAKGYPIKIVTSDAFSDEKLNHMKALGASLVMIPSNGGGITKALFTEMIEATRRMSLQENTFWPDQMNNYDMLDGYTELAAEICEQAPCRISTFVHAVGTCGSLRGVSTELRRRDTGIQVVAVEPSESPVLSGGSPGAHSIEGMGAGFIVHHWSPDLASEIQTVSTSEAYEGALNLAKFTSIFAGPSSGANFVAASRVAERLPPDDIVITLFPDTGFKYLSTPLYSRPKK